MTTIFPPDPVIGDIYQSYEWDGEAWVLIGIDFTKDYAVYPLQTGNNGKFLTTNGAVTSWGTVDLTTKANINSPNLTGIPTAPTAAANTNTTQLATTSFVTAADNLKANLATPNFTTDIEVNAGTLSNTASTVLTPLALNSTTTNGDYLRFKLSRESEGSDWRSAAWKIQRTVDATNMGYIEFGNGDGVTSGGNVRDVRIGSNATDIAIFEPSQIDFKVLATAPTAAFGTNTTQIATTSFVQSAVDSVSLNTQTSSYTLVLSDAGTLVIMNLGSANNLTVPLNSSVPFAVGTQVPILQLGTGQTTIVATSGVTIRFTPGLKLRTQYSAGALIKIDTDTWLLSGDIVA